MSKVSNCRVKVIEIFVGLNLAFKHVQSNMTQGELGFVEKSKPFRSRTRMTSAIKSCTFPATHTKSWMNLWKINIILHITQKKTGVTILTDVDKIFWSRLPSFTLSVNKALLIHDLQSTGFKAKFCQLLINSLLGLFGLCEHRCTPKHLHNDC